MVGGGGRTGAGDRTEVFDGGVNGARTPHRERAFVPVREHSRRPAARVFANFSRCHAGNGRGAGHPERARGGVGRARRDNARARPARHPAGRVGNVHDGAHRASHALALVRMARPAATNTRPKCTARASRPESAKSAPAWQLPPFLFVTSRRVTNPQLDTTRTNRGAADASSGNESNESTNTGTVNTSRSSTDARGALLRQRESHVRAGVAVRARGGCGD